MTVDEGERSTEGGLDFIDIKPGAASLQWKSDDSVAQSKARADFARRFPDSKSNPFGEEPEPEPTNLVTSSPTKLMTSSWIEVGVEADDDDGPPSPVMPSPSPTTVTTATTDIPSLAALPLAAATPTAPAVFMSPEEAEFAECDAKRVRTWRYDGGGGGAAVAVPLEENTGHIHSGLRLWAGAERLAELLCREPTLVRGQRVLELGAGCGLVSAVAAELGAASVTATDRPSVLPRLRANAALLASGKSYAVAPLEWGAAAPPPSGPAATRFDVVLGADVSYHHAEVGPNSCRVVSFLWRWSRWG